MLVRRPCRGFTLIELVAVIIVVAILAATALPRFTSLAPEAHQAVYQAAFSDFRSAVGLYHSGWLANGSQGAVTDLASFGEGNVDSNEQGFPAGINYNGTLTGTNCGELWTGLLNSDLTTRTATDGSFDGNTSTPIKYWYRSDPSACYYIYVGEKNDTGVDLPTLTYTLETGQTEINMASYSNGS
ncbi:prepilin-type N-terminal cleavage/methylation domain-containing protein [Ferrimonas sediminum]|uniref:Prepilin-type N-terminal cleavage/methylation domain-containing protein n=1 Tax=Ferrimonas sediminum TaxID=718193 RepID=A0A1G8SC53_9GAMM|nr:type II secretion system protein [Ferrimonas sediminum]SDJ26816.1 prepilin-type N-terminal cleavage/methylation domain-containing protein [Ferrimonas sediminum]